VDSGNAGMLDLVAALEWVRDNISDFGGDPRNVTIFGESGGGAKVSVLMAMPAAQGLFHKAIIQSGPDVETANRSDGTENARLVLDALGLAPDQAAALRELPAERLLQAQIAVSDQVRKTATHAERRRKGFNPVAEGRHLPGGPFAPTAPAISASVPLMIGTTKDEMNLFLCHAPWVDGLTESGMVEPVRGMLGGRAPTIVASYRRLRPHDPPEQIVFAIATDLGIRLPSLVTAERKLAQAAAPVFVYLFTWETPVLGGRLKSPHTLEIPFVFDNVESAPITGDGPTRALLARRMSQSWVAFARSGNPRNATIPEWPVYSVERRETMVFDDVCRLERDPLGAERRVWDA